MTKRTRLQGRGPTVGPREECLPCREQELKVCYADSADANLNWLGIEITSGLYPLSIEYAAPHNSTGDDPTIRKMLLSMALKHW